MKYFKIIFITALFLTLIARYFYSAVPTAPQLVGEYKHATNLQRKQLDKHYKYAPASVEGTVKNVEDWNCFDERTDKKALYYRVVTTPQTTPEGAQYQVYVIYKDMNKAKKINEGQKINMEGALLRVVDEKIQFSVWVYADELTPEDKVMLGSQI